MMDNNENKRFCSHCGKEISINADVCIYCGFAVEKKSALMKKNNINENNIPEEYSPLSAWDYIGYEFLFSVPIVGFIIVLSFSFGGTKNKNLRNFARSYLCYFFLFLLFVLGVLSIFHMLVRNGL